MLALLSKQLSLHPARATVATTTKITHPHIHSPFATLFKLQNQTCSSPPFTPTTFSTRNYSSAIAATLRNSLNSNPSSSSNSSQPVELTPGGRPKRTFKAIRQSWTDPELKRLSELGAIEPRLTWFEVAHHFPDRSAGSLAKKLSKLRREQQSLPTNGDGQGGADSFSSAASSSASITPTSKPKVLRKKNRPWSDEQVELLKKLHELHGSNWSTIAILVSEKGKFPIRYCNECERKFVMLDPKMNFGTWRKDEVERLLKVIKTQIDKGSTTTTSISAPSSSSSSPSSLSSSRLPFGPNTASAWKKVAEAVGTRTASQCRVMWRSKMAQLLKPPFSTLHSPIQRQVVEQMESLLNGEVWETKRWRAGDLELLRPLLITLDLPKPRIGRPSFTRMDYPPELLARKTAIGISRKIDRIWIAASLKEKSMTMEQFLDAMMESKTKAGLGGLSNIVDRKE